MIKTQVKKFCHFYSYLEKQQADDKNIKAKEEEEMKYYELLLAEKKEILIKENYFIRQIVKILIFDSLITNHKNTIQIIFLIILKYNE